MGYELEQDELVDLTEHIGLSEIRHRKDGQTALKGN